MFRRLILVSLLAAAGAVHAQLPEPMARALQAAGIPEDAVGAVVLRGGVPLVSHNPDRPMQPASTMKLVTTLVGLDQLGPVFKARTELRSGAEVVNGVLQGDLYLRGGADPDFNEDVLVHMLEKLRTQGIRKIEGDLVLDRQLFQPARTDLGLAPFDESPEAYYNIIPDALLLNMNLLRVNLASTGNKLKLDMLPQLERVTIESDMRLVDADCAKWDDGWKLPDYTRKGSKIIVRLHGTFPKNCSKTTVINVLERNDYTERLFRSTWARLGGIFTGTAREAAPAALSAAASAAATGLGAAGHAAAPAAPAGTRLLAEHVSRPLAEVLRDINKPSDNGLARTLFLTLGSLEPDPVLGSRPIPALPLAASPAASPAVLPGDSLSSDTAAPAATQAALATAAAAEAATPSRSAMIPGGGEAIVPAATNLTAARAEQVIRAWMQRHAIDDTGLVLENGSGLSRLERVRPAQMAGLLQAAQKSLWMPEFLTSLPIAAVDGTMKRRLKDSPAAARARVKTGTLKNVVAIAGYVPDANGELCIVVAMINHELTGNGNGRKAIDALIDWVAQSGR
ncbi:D-alanyl-D-alanine carboxypeptidase [Massilia sp. Root418]|jgi:D-alanyl-D-alanine carboxypeptidase/D-alanyl-D-alanine-endopeptidase (penicillin-binding protein 4)|uniref:D-alanyl-D-alanine carboxypeptidase/D-alanyl-D-alanine-endopeptidase n=1 Tax=Massilia sp. Root418 TaxID=1736532 RepID=UPI000700E9EE|nr:D-alanyl-D-alanine carboxypeptidase [Massilia sp. Root418]KQW89898.1 D-alanyl-D-alanine carboxypeptidase [Massilia sp. Root418]